VGDVAHAIGEIFLSHVDREVCAQLLADLQARVAGAAQDDAFRTERLAELYGDEADRPWPENQHCFAGDVTAHEIDGPERRGSRGHHARLLEREVVGQAVQRVDVIDSVLGEASVARETFRPMPFFEIAVIQARGIPSFDAVLAALASLVYLDGDA